MNEDEKVIYAHIGEGDVMEPQTATNSPIVTIAVRQNNILAVLRTAPKSVKQLYAEPSVRAHAPREHNVRDDLRSLVNHKLIRVAYVEDGSYFYELTNPNVSEVREVPGMHKKRKKGKATTPSPPVVTKVVAAPVDHVTYYTDKLDEFLSVIRAILGMPSLSVEQLKLVFIVADAMVKSKKS